ncbi:integrase catalytic subunit [Caballeronia choica]|uniref:Integrase catalytic subunit n=1 Tax=Caballeronia choica TaxID=326476 RepID=A0A158L6B5_9BURK|nr:integrase catalytic subunit [Caballeronia choica]
MNERGFITATMQELERIKVIEAVCEHRLTMVGAAARLGLCERQISRLAQRYASSGPAGLVSGKRGQPSNRELPADLRARSMALVRECGAPRAQYQGCADLCAEMSGIGGNGAQGFGGYIKQQAVDHRLVVPGDRTDRGGQREDHVVILHGQQIGLTCFEPPVCGARLALWAMAVPTRNGVHSVTCLMGSSV